MYFWNIKKLKSDLIEGTLTERKILQYLIANTILFCIAMIPFYENNQLDVLYSVITIPVAILGVIYAYMCNGGDKGNDFLVKLLAISWVITIRFLVVTISIAFLVGFFVLDIPEETTSLDVAIYTLLNVIIFWRIAVHVKGTNTALPNEPVAEG